MWALFFVKWRKYGIFHRNQLSSKCWIRTEWIIRYVQTSIRSPRLSSGGQLVSQPRWLSCWSEVYIVVFFESVGLTFSFSDCWQLCHASFPCATATVRQIASLMNITRHDRANPPCLYLKKIVSFYAYIHRGQFSCSNAFLVPSVPLPAAAARWNFALHSKSERGRRPVVKRRCSSHPRVRLRCSTRWTPCRRTWRRRRAPWGRSSTSSAAGCRCPWSSGTCGPLGWTAASRTPPAASTANYKAKRRTTDASVSRVRWIYYSTSTVVVIVWSRCRSFNKGWCTFAAWISVSSMILIWLDTGLSMQMKNRSDFWNATLCACLSW